MYYDISDITVVTVEVVTFIMTLRSLICGHEHFVGICYHQLMAGVKSSPKTLVNTCESVGQIAQEPQFRLLYCFISTGH